MSRNNSEPEFPRVESITLSQEEINNVSEDSLSPENRQGLLKVLGNAIGFDITAITLPVTLNEPMSFLMRLCEGTQYSDLLDKAAMCEKSTQRLLYVSLFALSFYCSAERTGKPFNPLLGETYEYVDDKRGIRVICEQVSHHPPIGAIRAESENWIFWQSQTLKTKFSGNSVDATVIGSSNVLFKETKEHFKWSSAKTSVHNVIIGKMWLDHYGDIDVVNKATGEVANLHLKQCGWFSSGWHEISGDICDTQGKPMIQITGKWNDAIYGKIVSSTMLSDSPSTTLSKKEEKKLEKQLKKERKKEAKDFKKQIKKQLASQEPLWVHTNRPLPPASLPQNGIKYTNDWSAHALQISDTSASIVEILPPTDSRLRADRLALFQGDVKKAAAEKFALEERQREDRRKRETQGKAYSPRYFKLSKDEDGEDVWEYIGGYWEEREKRIQSLKQ